MKIGGEYGERGGDFSDKMWVSEWYCRKNTMLFLADEVVFPTKVRVEYCFVGKVEDYLVHEN